jgi:hypothetical protein
MIISKREGACNRSSGPFDDTKKASTGTIAVGQNFLRVSLWRKNQVKTSRVSEGWTVRGKSNLASNFPQVGAQLETTEHVANAAIDIPGVSTGKVLPPSTDPWTQEHSQSSDHIPSDFKFEDHRAFRAPFPIDSPIGMRDAPPVLAPKRIELDCCCRNVNRASSSFAPDRDLLSE